MHEISECVHALAGAGDLFGLFLMTIRKKGWNVIISPSNRETFLERLNDVLKAAQNSQYVAQGEPEVLQGTIVLRGCYCG